MGMGPLQNVQMPLLGCPNAGTIVPWTAMGPGPLQYRQMSLLGGMVTRGGVPWMVMQPRKLQHGQIPLPGRCFAKHGAGLGAFLQKEFGARNRGCPAPVAGRLIAAAAGVIIIIVQY